ncbi:proteasome lid subunit RPN8/RPN11 [Kordia periserrulae]|uniref:Proteasome lid subunit RPN8/RPN11 n=1 Tax=Kordia periserrulae TaxID=701523 RepID=A0A2T6BYG0_9FLAO|nr:Mov34/MPN/PAD-1 family protein [Kordia periserrulae]PTX61109.1 proteasome lid subunit RPN8/RPN11 [Kordia periserrulae]
MEKLENEILKIRAFFDAHNRIKYFEEVKVGEKYIIEFELNLETYISQNETTDIFRFELEISSNKHNNVFEIFVKDKTNVPFHPHFKNFKIINKWFVKRSQWIDYVKNKHDIVTFVKRMIRSLQYQKEYIKPKFSVNKKARDWYLMCIHEGSEDFPTDSFFSNQKERLEIPKGQVKKKFDVQKKQTHQIVKKIKKFDIVANESYNPTEKILENNRFEIDHNLKTQNENIKSDALLYISNNAKKEIWKHIQWGNQETQSNKKEQGGILLGNVFYDTEKKVQFGVVEEVVAGTNARGSSVYLEMSHEIWAQMLSDADKILGEREDDPLQIIGWYHTHPNGLDVFMSGTDMNTQRKYFNQDWHYAIIFNPHKQIWKSFVGENALECKGFFLEDDDSNSPITEKPTVHKISKKKVLPFSILITLVLVITSAGIFQIFKKTTKKSDVVGEQNLYNASDCLPVECLYHLEQNWNGLNDSISSNTLKE